MFVIERDTDKIDEDLRFMHAFFLTVALEQQWELCSMCYYILDKIFHNSQ